MSRTVLKVNNINVFYGQIQALYDVCLEVHEGKIVSFIGANGAGKTTTLKTLSNLIKAKSGEVIYIDSEGKETDLQQVDAADIIKFGIAHVPEGRQVFANLSVEDNLLLGAYILKDKEKIKQLFLCPNKLLISRLIDVIYINEDGSLTKALARRTRRCSPLDILRNDLSRNPSIPKVSSHHSHAASSSAVDGT